MGSLREQEKKSERASLIIMFCFLGWQLITLAACSKETIQVEDVTIKPPLKGYKITARLDNKQSGTTSEAKGLLTGSYSEKNKVLDYKIEFSGLAPTSIRIKKGPRGSTGSLVYEVPRDTLNAYHSGQKGQKVLTALQERDLIKGNWFIVIATEKFPEQEIRAQITLKSE